MPPEEYGAIPGDEDAAYQRIPRKTFLGTGTLITIIGFGIVAGLCFGIGFGVGQNWNGAEHSQEVDWSHLSQAGLLQPQSFLPRIPIKEVKFDFPTKYADTGSEADSLWRDMMPIGAGFVRVPHPRRFDMPESKSIEGDPEEGEVYSLSITHQLHCLAVIRHVIMKYEKKDKSRYAGEGHEYHCIDYIRQAILCAGDTTLDYAAIVKGSDGVERRLGFTGANSTHQCRDWDAIRDWAIEHRSGDKAGILI
ncbi:uncharacterized protein RAG0_11329 [Rhynchosporium agropyri]|uniref:Oxidase ustYa n=1 Tax=Rhynchosporium agropyri TaxID=914238 RepID=A0A1E1L3I6_9HELO|nr:uncharacterized protein RAG0_11329 [Rhynchosporium agropyri]